jgi:hypothetical protein
VPALRRHPAPGERLAEPVAVRVAVKFDRRIEALAPPALREQAAKQLREAAAKYG